MEGQLEIPNKLYFKIGDVSDLVGVKPYVLRYWESEFPAISPDKSSTGQRVYKRNDVEMLLLIKHLLYSERYSIEGACKRIRDLRKQGRLKEFKQEKIYGDQAKVKQKARFQQVHQLAKEIDDLVSLSKEEIFKF